MNVQRKHLRQSNWDHEAHFFLKFVFVLTEQQHNARQECRGNTLITLTEISIQRAGGGWGVVKKRERQRERESKRERERELKTDRNLPEDP